MPLLCGALATPPTWRRVLTAVTASLALLSLAGCMPSQRGPARGPDGKTCGERLIGGAWRFTGFTPATQLDPQASSALEQVHGSLRVSFDGQRALTTGPGLYHVGPYQIDGDDGTSCRIVAPDDNGIVTDRAVRFLDQNNVEIFDQRSAVPGRSTMQRVPFGQ